VTLQDALVTALAVGAAGALGWRWYKSRNRPAGACPSCASGNPCAPEKPDEG